jgi:hypothetical protein
MVTETEIAKSIEDALNASTAKYRFNIIPLVGDFKTAFDARAEQLRELSVPVINGVLLPIPSPITPIKDLGNFNRIFQLSFIVKKRQAQAAAAILNTYIEDNIGNAADFGGYAGIMNFDNLSVGSVSQESPIGTGLPLMTMVYYQFIKGGMISNVCKVFIDGVKTQYLNCSVGKTRILETNAYDGHKNMKSAITQQGVSFEITLPYVKNDLTKKLLGDLLDGGLNEIYTVIYDDGFIAPRTFEMLASSANEGLVPGKIPGISVVFMEADTGADAEEE